MCRILVESILRVNEGDKEYIFRPDDIITIIFKDNERGAPEIRKGRLLKYNHFEISLDVSTEFNSDIVRINTNTISEIYPGDVIDGPRNHLTEEDIERVISSDPDVKRYGPIRCSLKMIGDIIKDRSPKGLFYTVTKNDNERPMIIAVDNERGDAFTEDFVTVSDFLKWIKMED